MPGNAKIRTSQLSSTLPAVRAIGVQQTIPAGGAHAVLNFDSELYDAAALHKSTTDTSRLTAPVAGIYRISISVSWPLRDNSTGYRDVRLVESGPGEPERVIARDRRPGFAQQSSAQTASTEYKLAAGDYVQAEVAQTSGGDLPLIKLSYTMSWVAPGRQRRASKQETSEATLGRRQHDSSSHGPR